MIIKCEESAEKIVTKKVTVRERKERKEMSINDAERVDARVRGASGEKGKDGVARTRGDAGLLVGVRACARSERLVCVERGYARLVVCRVVGDARRRAETVVGDNDGMRGTRDGEYLQNIQARMRGEEGVISRSADYAEREIGKKR